MKILDLLKATTNDTNLHEASSGVVKFVPFVAAFAVGDPGPDT
jgi:hypothetical protein